MIFKNVILLQDGDVKGIVTGMRFQPIEMVLAMKPIITKKILFWAINLTFFGLINGCVPGQSNTTQNPQATNSATPITETSQSSSKTPVIPPTSLTSTTENLTTPPSSADVDSLYGTWNLRYSAGGIVHESILEMNGNVGKMQTKFFDVSKQSSETVEQRMTTQNSSRGLILEGSNPIYPGTKNSYPSYNPDSFLFAINPDGTRTIKFCDSSNTCGIVEIISYTENL